MVNISTNFVKTDNYLSPQIIQRQKYHVVYRLKSRLFWLGTGTQIEYDMSQF